MGYKYCKNVLLLPSSGKAFSVFDIHVMTTKGEYSFLNHGKTLYHREPIAEPIYGDYLTLPASPKFVFGVDTGLSRALYEVVENCVNYLDGGGFDSLSCTSMDAIKVHEVYKKLKEAVNG
jgi:hypothetical protein